MPFKNKEVELFYKRDWVKKRKRRLIKGRKCYRCGSKRYLKIIKKGKELPRNFFSYAEYRIREYLRRVKIVCRKCYKDITLKKKCKHGHPLTKSNIVTWRDRQRRCLTCERRRKREWKKRWYERQKKGGRKCSSGGNTSRKSTRSRR